MSQIATPATGTDPTADGAAWAAMLAAGIGGAAFAVATVLSEASATAARVLLWYRPAGSLSGVAGVAVLVWAATWVALHLRWRGRQLRHQTALMAATCALVVLSLLATFPPIYELF